MADIMDDNHWDTNILIVEHSNSNVGQNSFDTTGKIERESGSWKFNLYENT